MARSARAGRIAWLLAALVAGAACDGKVIHLGDGRSDASPPCPHAQIAGDQVLWIGDSWILVTGSEHTRVRDLARAAGAIGPNDDYVIGAAAASNMATIANQYAAQEAGAVKVKVVIMDGGTWDTLTAMNPDMTAPDVAVTFGQLLAQIASDGTVQDVIYFLVPEIPTIAGVAALRPLMRQACAASAVPCHFIDLQPLWSSHPEYTDANLIFLPTEEGSMAVADTIWSVMQQGCIAQ